MRTLTRTFLIFFSLLVAGCAWAADVTSSLSGSIYDPQGRAIQGAQILLFAETNPIAATTSNSAGVYRFDHLPEGDYLLEAHAPGFSVSRVEKLHLEPDSKRNIDIRLTLTVVQQQVSVTASTTPQSVDELSKAVSIIDKAALAERQDYSLADAVRLTPGLRVAQAGGPGALTQFYFRGLRAQDTAVLVDGLRLRDVSSIQADASALLEDVLITDVNRIEVLRGSGSSLYGTNAIGGVVNIITDPGGGKTHGSLLTEGGSLGLFRGNALVTGGMEENRVQYSAGLTHLNVINGVGGNQPARITSGQGRLAIRLFPGTQLISRFLGADSVSRLSVGPQLIATSLSGVIPAIPQVAGNAGAAYIPSIADPDYNRRGRYGTGGLTLQSEAAEKLGYRIDYHIVDSMREYGNGPSGPGYQPNGITLSGYSGRIQTVRGQANYQPSSTNLLTGGYEFEQERFGNRNRFLYGMGTDSSVEVSQMSHSAFLQDQARLLGDRLYLSVAGRFQSFSLDRPSFVPAASAPFGGSLGSTPPAAYTGDFSAAYRLNASRTKVRAHVGRGYRVPSLYERFGAGYDSFLGYSVYGDPRLKPEQSIAVDAGLEQTMFGNRLRLSATYFYTYLQRTIIFDFSGLINPATDPFGRYLGYLNSKGRLARGEEVTSEWAAAKNLSLSASYTHTDARERSPLIPGVYRSFIIPEHQFTAFAVQRFGPRLYMDLALNAGSSYLSQVYGKLDSAALRFPGMKRADLGVSYRVPFSDSVTVRFFGKAENLFDQTYYESGFRTPGVTARAGLQLEF